MTDGQEEPPRLWFVAALVTMVAAACVYVWAARRSAPGSVCSFVALAVLVGLRRFFCR